MAELTDTITKLQAAGVFTAMIYLQEAHADDLWPMGYGVQSYSTIHDRLRACESFLDKHSNLKGLLDAVAVDTMDDEFLHTFGEWPERYFLANLSGNVVWASTVSNDETLENGASETFQEALAFVEASAPLLDGED